LTLDDTGPILFESASAEGAAMDTCPNCGMERTEWRGNGGQGVESDGRIYCCQGCLDGGAEGCTCR
jgi:hypothetical protein